MSWQRAGGMVVVAAWLLVAVTRVGVAGDPPENNDQETAAERGYRLLRTKAYLPPDFDDEVFGQLWKTWPEPLRSEAKKATAAQRRKMAFRRYGIMESPDGQGKALGYVDDGSGGWVMNCFVCHGGKVAGKIIPGLPNSHYGLQTLTEDVRTTKARLGKKFSHMDLGSFGMPLGTTHGTTNAVMFGVTLSALRDADLNVHLNNPRPKMLHHDMDAPPFWNVRKKTRLYADGGPRKNHRLLLQFLLIPKHGPETLKGWEDDYRDVLAWIESIKPPKYPFAVDRQLAGRGHAVFERTCSRCHGTYGENSMYPNKIVPIDIVGTDPIRSQALSKGYRRALGKSWFMFYDPTQVLEEPGGYVAPPLDGIWASAPYFHNGSVPTLWHVLHPDKRPVVWQRTEDGYDQHKVGLEAARMDAVPASLTGRAARRRYFDTHKRGKSAAGHRFPDDLSEEEKRSVLEYLKTL